MQLHDIVGCWLRRPEPARAPAARGRARRLGLERLEDRTVMASYTAANVADLIAHINAANLTPESDTIALAAGTTFSLTSVDNTAHGPTGLPLIAANEDLTIIGEGATIERSSAPGTPTFRLFDVAAGATLTLKNLTLQGGMAFGSGFSAQGGAIYNQGTSVLDGATVQNNTAQGDAGFLSWGFAVPGGPAAGGGLYSKGTLTMAGCTLIKNVAIGGGGAAGAILYADGPLPVRGGPGGSAFGGGLYVAGGMVTINDSTLTANTARGGDGGKGVSLERRVDNAGPTEGGDGGRGLGGGLYVAGGSVALHDTGATENLAKGGAGGAGGRKGSKRRPDGAPGQGIGGGIYIDTTASVGMDTFTQQNVRRNSASTSKKDIAGSYTLIP